MDTPGKPKELPARDQEFIAAGQRAQRAKPCRCPFHRNPKFYAEWVHDLWPDMTPGERWDFYYEMACLFGSDRLHSPRP